MCNNFIIQITKTFMELRQSKFTEINNINLATYQQLAEVDLDQQNGRKNCKIREIIRAKHLFNHQGKNFFGSTWNVFRGEAPAEVRCLIDLETK